MLGFDLNVNHKQECFLKRSYKTMTLFLNKWTHNEY